MPIIILFIVVAIIVSLAGVFINPDKNVSFLPEEQNQEQQVSQSGSSNKSSDQSTSQTKTTIDPNFPINSYIRQGPVKQAVFSDTTEVTFEFDAILSGGVSASDLYFETTAEEVDSKWIKTTQKSRTVIFPDGQKEYTFWVRGRTDTMIEPTPAEITIKINVSSYYNEINISSFKKPDASANPSLITISTKLASDQTVNITGWKLEGKKKSILIPSGAEIYNPNNDSSWKQNIILKKGDTIYISSEPSPFGVSTISFRPNKCMGYYLKSIDFPISISSNCPKPTSDSLSSFLTPECKNFITTKVGTCEFPSPTKISEARLYSDTYCMDYLNTNFNYNGCVNNYSNDSNFSLSKWHIYTDTHDNEIMDRFGDTVYLKDSNGLVVAKYCYEEFCK
ncbi:MAG: hypothetical protein ABID67_01940 [Candidatus Nealsonbacteria bacterium]